MRKWGICFRATKAYTSKGLTSRKREAALTVNVNNFQASRGLIWISNLFAELDTHN